MARGAYLKQLGNTPGHLNHWSKRSFVTLLSRHGDVVAGALAVSVDHAACPPRVAPSRLRHQRSGYGRGARVLSIGIATTGLVTFAYFALAAHALTRRRVQAHLARLVDHVRRRVGDLPADRAAAVAHDRRPPRARPDRRPQPARRAAHPGGVRADVPRRRAGAARPAAERPLRRLGGAVLGARRRRPGLRGELLRARLPGRPPALRALRPARLPRGGLAGLLRAGGRRRDRVGAVGGRARAWRSRRSCRCSSCRGSSRAATPAAAGPGRGRGDRGRADAAPRPRLRGRGLRDHGRRADAAQRRRADRRGHRPTTPCWRASSSACC